MNKIIIFAVTIMVIAFASCDSSKQERQRYTFHKLSDNKVIIIDQNTGKIAKYEFSATTFSPGSLIILEPEWNKKKK